MGPPFLNGGNLSFQPGRWGQWTASMGPPFLNGGNACCVRGFASSSTLQWGRRFSTAETPQRRNVLAGQGQASMGPPFLNGGNVCHASGPITQSSLQWGRRFSTAETCSTGSARRAWEAFNGAAVSQRRKPLPRVRRTVGHGPFNGAAVSQRRKPTRPPRACAGLGTLQWGRRFSTAETSPPSAAFPFSPPPSMGPPFLNGGNARPFVQ